MNAWLSKIAIAMLDYSIHGNGLRRAYAELDQSQWWPQEKILDYQWAQVRRMVEHAYARVPYYRTVFEKAGLTPQDIQTPEDYLRIPILTKDALRANLEEMVDPQADRKQLRKSATGGSTGEPTPYYQGYTYSIYGIAATYRNTRWTGWDLGEKVAQLWGSAFDVSLSQSWRGWINHTFRNTRMIAAFDMSREAMSRYARGMKTFDPDLIIGYVDALYLLTSYLLEQGLQGSLRSKAVISSAGTLYEYQRQTIESAFGCPVFNRYGGRELGDIAQECQERNGLHINAETVYLEVLRDGHPCGPGEEGELILTSLTNFDMPFIRYAIGDRGVLAEPDRICRCGRGLPLLEAVTGRVQDVVATPGGRFVSGAFFPHLFKEVENVRQFQVVQEEKSELTIKVASVIAGRPIDIDFAREKIAEFLGADVNVVFEVVDVIPPGASGKLRPVISKVPVRIAGYQTLPAKH